MSKLAAFKLHLKQGKVYRREELVHWTNAVDRHIAELVSDGTLQKVSAGVYYYPKKSVFGQLPPDETVLVRAFLKDDKFLITTPNAYNTLGVGTTQLYNTTTVYNHKRHGKFKLGNRTFDFHMKHYFPDTLTKEFLLIDLINNLDQLAEDPQQILKSVAVKIKSMNHKRLVQLNNTYTSIRAKKILSPMLNLPKNVN